MRLGIVGVVGLLSSLMVLGVCRSSGGVEERSPGEIAFRRYCQTCHSLPKPRLKTDEQWPQLVLRYGERAKLSPQQIDQIVAYLIAHN
ncbi:MAG TPA: cytochrome c [Candidatus Deferrimicrobium sp.]|nr:cytochrome c [Candidatus Deferrimicrobium sp.]